MQLTHHLSIVSVRCICVDSYYTVSEWVIIRQKIAGRLGQVWSDHDRITNSHWLTHATHRAANAPQHTNTSRTSHTHTHSHTHTYTHTHTHIHTHTHTYTRTYQFPSVLSPDRYGYGIDFGLLCNASLPLCTTDSVSPSEKHTAQWTFTHTPPIQLYSNTDIHPYTYLSDNPFSESEAHTHKAYEVSHSIKQHMSYYQRVHPDAYVPVSVLYDMLVEDATLLRQQRAHPRTGNVVTGFINRTYAYNNNNEDMKRRCTTTTGNACVYVYGMWWNDWIDVYALYALVLLPLSWRVISLVLSHVLCLCVFRCVCEHVCDIYVMCVMCVWCVWCV